MDCVVGIDVGGTNTKMMAMDLNGEVLIQSVTPTVIDTPEASFSAIAAAVQAMADRHGDLQIAAIGVGIPGPVNSRTGVAYRVPNFGWYNVDIRGMLQHHFSCPIVVDNDGNINLRGEWKFGAGQGAEDLLLLTLGTGIGGGILTNGTVVLGASSLAGEIGHITVDHSDEPCSCGQTGHLESYCSGKALVRYARELAGQHPQSWLGQLDPASIAVKDVFAGYDQQDVCCEKVLDRFVEYFSMGLANLIHIFNPEKIILGGGISHGIDLILDKLSAKVADRLMDQNMCCPIVRGTLFEEAGTTGACALALQQLLS